MTGLVQYKDRRYADPVRGRCMADAWPEIQCASVPTVAARCTYGAPDLHFRAFEGVRNHCGRDGVHMLHVIWPCAHPGFKSSNLCPVNQQFSREDSTSADCRFSCHMSGLHGHCMAMAYGRVPSLITAPPLGDTAARAFGMPGNEAAP